MAILGHYCRRLIDVDVDECLHLPVGCRCFDPVLSSHCFVIVSANSHFQAPELGATLVSSVSSTTELVWKGCILSRFLNFFPDSLGGCQFHIDEVESGQVLGGSLDVLHPNSSVGLIEMFPEAIS